MPFVENRGARIYWDEQGQGVPMLLIMGLGYPSDMWHRPRPELAAHYRTIALDNRGSGRSDAGGSNSIALMASDAAAVLDASGVDRAHIFGVSMGGMIAQEFALRYPQRVRSLILACTHPGGLHAKPPKIGVFQALWARATMTTEEARKVFIPILYDASTSRERIEEDFAILKNWIPTPAAFRGQLRAIFWWHCYSRLPRITAPTLVIHGESDRLVPPQNGELIASRIPGAKLVMIPHAGHIFGTDQPEASRRAVAEFLAQVEAPQAGNARPRK
ncbi:MAG TPA: alpha/beta fold hydrolase [Terriglobales bacterium]|jgi:pimeloyl-ACP methyl ester carboxylesterase|nr:alpha/beta fold hydrolase [Terriglobales bacterium]